MKLSTGKRINASVTTAGGSATQRIDRLIGEEVRADENIHVPERRKTTTWRDFIRRHMDVLAGTDFFTN